MALNLDDLLKIFFTGSIIATTLSLTILFFLSDKNIRQKSIFYFLAIAAFCFNLSFLSTLIYIFSDAAIWIYISNALLIGGGGTIFVSLIPVILTIRSMNNQNAANAIFRCDTIERVQLRWLLEASELREQIQQLETRIADLLRRFPYP